LISKGKGAGTINSFPTPVSSSSEIDFGKPPPRAACATLARPPSFMKNLEKCLKKGRWHCFELQTV
jgi:hypothetical protein